MKWKVKSEKVPQSVDEVIETLLLNRGIVAFQEKKLFFDATVTDILPDLFKLFDQKTISKVIKRITQAIQSDEPIFIHGDYDVDGISATGILWETLYRDLGYKNVHPFIPHRIHHGYGVSKESIDEIVRSTPEGSHKLIITVDCGITAREAIEYGKSLGLDFIVTDHHTIQDEKKPIDIPIVHTYELCGAGIAWVLSLFLKKTFRHSGLPAQAGLSRIDSGVVHDPSVGTPQNDVSVGYQQGLDLVALATISDIQSLTGFNRVLVKEGISLLTNTMRIGLQKLYEVAGISGHSIGQYEVGWVIGPRLNAMGRLEHALDSLRLLCTTDSKRALEMAQKMHETNAERQLLTQQAIAQSVEMVFANNWQNDLILVVMNEQWNEGILGLIAGKLVERFGVPVIVLGKSEGIYKGSARSVDNFNIIDAIKSQDQLLIDAGGHAMAAGLSIESDKIEEFRQKMCEFAAESFKGEKPTKCLSIDMEFPSLFINENMVDELNTLEPFGFGNPKPVFLTNLKVIKKRIIGSNGNHIKIALISPEDNQHRIDAVGFGMGERINEIEQGQTLSWVYTLEKDTFYDQPRVQLKLKDFAPLT